MPPNIKRVFYVNNVAAPVFLDMLAARPDIQVDRLENESTDADAEPILALAHAYQIGSTRQELAMTYQGYAPLLARCPNLLVLSTSGAGYDTVNLADATEAGVAVVNQAGGNKEGVAEHVLGMMLALSKRLVASNHVMRSGVPYHRRDFIGDDVQGRTIGIVGIGHVGTRVAEQLARWFDTTTGEWDHLRTDVIPHGQPAQAPPFSPKRRVALGDGLFVCGDHRDTASLQGAMFSGERTAAAVVGYLRG